MLMKKLGHTFLLVENGLEAVNAVLAYWKSVDAAKAAFGNGEFVGTSSVPIVMMHKFDICLMDISMPVCLIIYIVHSLETYDGVVCNHQICLL